MAKGTNERLPSDDTGSDSEEDVPDDDSDSEDVPSRTKGTNKRLPSDDSEEEVPSKKKLKTTLNLSRRSKRTSKGTGGAADQLKKVGDAVLTRSKKSRPDRLADLGEALNPMAPLAQKVSARLDARTY